MKTILLLSVFLAGTVTLKAQQTEKDSIRMSLHKQFVKKERFYKTAGWLMFATGVGLTVGGITSGMDRTLGAAPPRPNTAGNLVIAGGAAMVASIPLFLIARENQRRARVALNNYSFRVNDKPVLGTSYTAVSLSFSIR